MKPAGPVARRGDYKVHDVPLHEAALFISAHHYARGCSNTAVYLHGLYKSDLLVGCALWLPPTKVCAMTVHGDWRRVLALSRLVIAPSEPQNAASFLIGASVQRIRRAGKWVALVTFADQSQGHTGAIYKATNWTYVGQTKPEARWEDATGRQVARKATHSRTRTEMEKLGHRMTGRFSKHKFVMVLR